MEDGGLTPLGEIYAAEALPESRAARAARLLAGLLHMIGADAGFVATPASDGRTLDVYRVTPFAQRLVRLALPIDAPYPLAETVRTDQPLFIASNQELACDHPGLVRVDPSDHACATVPLHAPDGTLLGAINVAFEDPHEFTTEERVVIDVAARRCAGVLADD